MIKEIVDSFVSMVTFKTVRSSLYTGAPFLHFRNLIDNLYSSNLLALPMNYPVIGLSQRDPPIQ